MRTYWFGSETDQWQDKWETLTPIQRSFQKTTVEEIVDVLDRFGKALLCDSVIPALIEESGFSEKEVLTTLALVPGLLSRESLERRLRGEFAQPQVLDRFMKLPGSSARVKAAPLGILLHVTAGNVFLGAIDSLVMGLLTKNLSLLKVSSANKVFPLFFARELLAFDQKKIVADKFAILHWKGGDKETEDLVKSRVNGIVAWGGEEMLRSYREGLPAGVKLLDFGPKVSLQVISRRGLAGKDLKRIAQKIADDIVPWDQAACSSPQDLFIEEGSDVPALMEAIDSALTLAPARGALSDDEATEILKEKYRGLYSELMESGKILEGTSHLLHHEKSPILRPSPLHRTLILKTFRSAADLSETLSPLSFYLQSCSYLLSEEEKEEFLGELTMAGIRRFAPLGTITHGMEGAPHDGRFVLRELVHFIGDEARIQDLGEETKDLRTSTEMKRAFETTPHPPGYIFSSGGTTGEPKFVHFSYEEFDFVTDMLAENFRSQGVTRGTVVANLFVAGNLWSSFMAVEKALEKLGAIQLPIGGLCSPENITMYLRKFSPEVVMGIPSLLISLAEQSGSLKVKKVFYAGEALSETRMNYLRENWGVDTFGSAGYASVDAGVIGYQCSHSSPGEHHLFSDLVKMDIIDEEAVVTSLYRTTMPIKNYRTGDRVMWIDNCSCGRKDPRFKLLGRTDNIIQIWSCRLRLEEIEKSLGETKTYQVVVTESSAGERLEIYLEGKLDEASLLRKIFDNSRDLRDTITFEEFTPKVRLVSVEAGLIPRNTRTGKISLVIDKRR